MRIKYGIWKRTKGKIEVQNGKMNFPGKDNDELSTIEIVNSIKAKHPGWMVQKYVVVK